MSARLNEPTLNWAPAYLSAFFLERTHIWVHAFLSARLLERMPSWAHAFLSARFLNQTFRITLKSKICQITLYNIFFRSELFLSIVLQGILENLPALYSLNVPRLNLLSSPEVRQPGKAPNYSVNWAKGFTAPEVVDAMKGKEQVSDFKTTFFLCEIKNFLILIFNNV